MPPISDSLILDERTVSTLTLCNYNMHKMKSICLYTILFTLPDKETNKYTDMFLMWLSCIVKNAGLTRDDKFVLLADKKSLSLLSKDTFDKLIDILDCTHEIIICDPVTNIKEGMLMRYTPFDYTQDVLLYLDVDILVLKDIHFPFENKLYAQAEGLLTDDNYGASIRVDKENRLGFSSGKFAIGSKDLRDAFFKDIIEFASNDTNTYFTVDQPYFNEAILYVPRTSIDIRIFANPVVSTNMEAYNATRTVLLDFMGMPGDESFHWNKIISAFCLINCGLL